MIPATSREIHLKRRPVGVPDESDFELVEAPVRDPGDGELLVRNIYMSVDPYMRGRMIDRKSYVSPFQLGQPLSGGSVGQVVASRHEAFAAGDYVLANKGWRDFFVSDGQGLRRIDPALVPIQAYLGVLGMPGFTAYVGLQEIGQPKEGETVFVSAASGAVGSIACQIAKIKGCRVVGSAGSPEKIAWLLDEAGIDGAFNYKEVDELNGELKRLCPEGIDVYFENVGGPQLEAALRRMNVYGRVVMCGMISQYSAADPVPGPSNLNLVIRKRLTLKGFIVFDHNDLLPQFYTDMSQWIRAGRIKWRETIVDGLENAPQAFIGLFRGENIGKMLVRIGPDPAI